MAELSDLMNIGKEMERKLKTVGINTAEDLTRQGDGSRPLKKSKQPVV